VVKTITGEDVWREVASVEDPEMPAITIGELGILREINIRDDGRVKVVFTPTYSGCPAMNFIEMRIIDKLVTLGIKKFDLEKRLSPAWTTDWMTDEGKKKLREIGIASPSRKTYEFLFHDEILCPNCGSKHVEMKSPFGSALCKAFFVCQDCLEPFDYIKPF